MKPKNQIKSYRLSGDYEDTVETILTLPDDERTPFLLDLAFIQLVYEKYEDCLTFLLTYISRKQPKTLNKNGCFYYISTVYYISKFFAIKPNY